MLPLLGYNKVLLRVMSGQMVSMYLFVLQQKGRLMVHNSQTFYQKSNLLQLQLNSFTIPKLKVFQPSLSNNYIFQCSQEISVFHLYRINSQFQICGFFFFFIVAVHPRHTNLGTVSPGATAELSCCCAVRTAHRQIFNFFGGWTRLNPVHTKCVPVILVNNALSNHF